MFRYALTIFLSAFLLFQVQPLISKFILPWFGGTPAVWTTAMLFFQVLLLGGYTYAHLVATKLTPRRQAIVHLSVLGATVIVHLAMLAAAVLVVPIIPGEHWKPSSEGSPTWQILLLLAVCVGLPYFVLATTSPLMQAWFSRTAPGRSPYRLYSLSNVGSLLALLSFPFVFEPWLPLRAQGWLWSAAFALVAALAGYCALRMWNLAPLAGAAPAAAAVGPGDAAPAEPEAPPGWGRRLMWLVLPACGSVMFLAVTNQMCLDVAVVPFFWVLPLCLYLLSFIICFDNARWYSRPVFWAWLAGGVLVLLWLMRRGVEAEVNIRELLTSLGLGDLLEKGGEPAVIWTQIIGYSAALFGCCMVCHGELVRLKPSPKHLTSFYLMVSAGGALGGVFVSLVATRLFKTYLEFHIGLWATCALAIAAFWIDKKPHRRWPVPWYAVLGVAAYFLVAALVVMFAPFEWLTLGGKKPLTTVEILGIWALVGLVGAGVAMINPRRWWWLGAALCFLLFGALLYFVPSKVAPESFDAIDLLKVGVWVACGLVVAAAWIERKPHRLWRTPWVALVGAAVYLAVAAAMLVYAPVPFPWLKVGGEPVSARALLSLWALLGLFIAGGWAFLERLGPRLLWWLAGACYFLLHAATFALHPVQAVPKDSLGLHAGLWVVCGLAMVAVWLDKKPPGEWPARWSRAAGAVVYHLAFGAVALLLGSLFPLKIGGQPVSAAGILRTWAWVGLLVAGLWVLAELRGRWRGWWLGAAACFLLLDAVVAAELFGSASWLKRPAAAVEPGHLLAVWFGCGLVALAIWQRAWVWALSLPLFLSALVYVGVDLGEQAAESLGSYLSLSRNFYGVLKVGEYNKSDETRHQYVLSHGRINHGAQLRSPEGRTQPITYFGERSGIGLALLHHPRKPQGLRVGVLGLGTGTIAAYGQKGDVHRFYEINPRVIELSGRSGVDAGCTEPMFTYLTDSAADCRCILGDGRLSLERQESQQFDVLAMDAFSSDAVPVHLLTAEAFDIYRRHIKPDGIIAVNVTNRFVDLRPVVRAQAKRLGENWRCVLFTGRSGSGSDCVSASDMFYCAWMLVTTNEDFLGHPSVAPDIIEEADGGDEGREQRPILWTDDYSNLFRILK